MMGFRSIILATLVILAVQCNAEEDDWWHHIQLYQIYPRSFMDHINRDGIGDIPGIRHRLQHLADIGVTATWISPIFESPMKDFGYDISDFYKIGEEYGSEGDLENLLDEAKKLGIRVLLDYVPNHTSDQCEWFKKSVNREEGWENFYVWHPGKPNITHPEERPAPPSNWISVFRGPAWTWHEERKEYYLHQFLKEQPDLNFRNQDVIDEMNRVMVYWLEKGVSGFRVDAIPHLVEVDVDEYGHYPDEPRSNLTTDTESYDYLEHIYTRERQETWNIIHDWRLTVDKFKDEHKTETKILLMEAMSEIDIVMQYYGNDTHPAAHFPFNFELVHLNHNANAVTLKKHIMEWFDKVPKGKITNWVIGNHDQPRATSRFGTNRIDGIMMLNMLLPGIAVTYQGEEIQMEDQWLSWNDTIDPQGCQAGPDLYEQYSRDPARTPFQWDDSMNSGFSMKPADNCCWLPVADNYKQLNLKAQRESDGQNAYNLYKELSNLRNRSVIKHGDFKIETFNDDTLAFTRSLDGETIIVVMNTANRIQNENLNSKFDNLFPNLRILLASKNVDLTNRQFMSSANIALGPYEAFVLLNSAGFLRGSFIMLCVMMILHFLK